MDYNHKQIYNSYQPLYSKASPHLVGEAEHLNEQLQVLDAPYNALLARVHECNQDPECWSGGLVYILKFPFEIKKKYTIMRLK